MHSYRVAEPEEDVVTYELIMTGWLVGCFSRGVFLAGGTNCLPEAGVGKWLAGGALSRVTAPLVPLCHFLCCLEAGGVVC